MSCQGTTNKFVIISLITCFQLFLLFIFSSNTTGYCNKSRARGVRFIETDSLSNQVHNAYLNEPFYTGSWGEVILSAGAIGSPQLLLLSGIGPKNHLKGLDIPLLLDSKDVGKGMKDNPGIALPVDLKPKNRHADTPQVVGIADYFKIIFKEQFYP